MFVLILKLSNNNNKMLENISKTNQLTNKQYYIYYFIYMIRLDPTTIYTTEAKPSQNKPMPKCPAQATEQQNQMRGKTKRE